MPGFDRKGPMGMGPMTGGVRGNCNPDGRSPSGGGLGLRFRGRRGSPRGNRNMFSASGRSWWRRFSSMGFRNDSLDTPYNREQEMGFLKEQANALRQELETIDNRLRELESNGRKSD